MAAQRRPRLVPKVVFRAALTATAVPLLGGCPQHLTVANRGYGVAQLSYGPVAQRAYEPEPVADAAIPPNDSASVDMTPVDASGDVKTDAAKLDAGKRDAIKP